MTSPHSAGDPDVQTRFLSLVSHEFRTPLTVILSSAELLESYGDNMAAQRRQSHFRRIHAAVGAMTSLLDNVSLLARFESGRFELAQEPLQLSGVLASMIEETESFQRVGQTVEIHCPSNTSAMADLRLLRACVVNLLSNALRFSAEHSPVELEVRRRADGFDLLVMDRGQGFPWIEENRLWEPFERGTNATGVAGSGLGLPIVRRCAQLTGGTAELSAREGGGTIARIFFPTEVDQ